MTESFFRSGGLLVADITGAPPSAAELNQILKRTPVLHIGNLSCETESLDFLLPVAPLIKELRVFSVNLKNWDALSAMKGLSSLDMSDHYNVPKLDLANMTRLREYSGPMLDGLFDLPALKAAFVVARSAKQLSGGTVKVERLGVDLPASLSKAPSIAAGSRAREVSLSGPRRLELSSVIQFAAVETLHLLNIKKLEEISALEALPQLKVVTLKDVHAADDVSMLADAGFHVELLRSLQSDAAVLGQLENVQLVE